jgi:hypothetical protein
LNGGKIWISNGGIADIFTVFAKTKVVVDVSPVGVCSFICIVLNFKTLKMCQKRPIDLIDLIIYCFTSRSRIFHLYGDITIASEGLQNLGLCSALRTFEQGGIFIVPHLL